MKIALLVPMLMLPAAAVAEKPAPNLADYTVAVHVQASRLLQRCTDVTGGSNMCYMGQDLSVVIDGKKFELVGDFGVGKKAAIVLRVGDYKAKMLKEDTSRAYEYSRTYEFLFPDGKTSQYTVEGESQ
jgi:hypothetical protein